ncbi:MAG: proprotein convertase P-domain-containing protein, partial [Candidatus Hydrogenedentes bacterium]|nr:proprotein convertase P-domain-containing protein [Candidatus Hydrogenedentota bacterium]
NSGVTAVLIDRPGYIDSGLGCDQANYKIILDDAGTGGAIEDICTADLLSPPGYMPNDALDVFNGLDSASDWTLTVSDNNAGNTGTLLSWCVAVAVRDDCSLPSVPIPDNDPIGVSDTLSISDAGIIADMNVHLNIEHSFVGDLVVTLDHMDSGTTVVLIDRPGYTGGSGFGCGQDNYAAIVLDDEGAGGAIEDMCEDDLTSPPNYTPNGFLSAFDGLNKASDWVLTVSDNAGGDTGTLNSWCVTFSVRDECSVPALPIPDDDPVGVGDTLTITDIGIIADMNVELAIDHPSVGDLVVMLEHVNSGVTAVLIDRPGYIDSGAGCDQANYAIVLDDAGTGGAIEDMCVADLLSPPGYTPNNPLSIFAGLNMASDWVLTVSDNNAGNVGTLVSWCVTFTVRDDCSLPALPIPDNDPVGVSDTITVFDAGIITDVDVTLNIEHIRVGHLAVTLEHVDSGTVITLIDTSSCTGDNYAIVLDDEGTGGAIADRCVDNLTSLPNYTPVERLAAFDGLDKASDWTITVSDHAGGGVGTLLSWCVTFSTLEGDCVVPVIPVPDDDPVGISDTAAFTEIGAITDLDVSLEIRHTWVGDLTVTLEHVNSGITTTLIDRPGYSGGEGTGCARNDYSITLDDDGIGGAIEDMCEGNLTSPPSYIPNEALYVFNGQDMASDWVLTVSDNVPGDVGTLVAWCLTPVLSAEGEGEPEGEGEGEGEPDPICAAPAPYPSDSPCYLQVIDEDPYCCYGEWDATCQQAYNDCAKEVYAYFEATPIIGVSPLDVIFTNLSEYTDGVHWDFGDSTESYDWEPVHTFTAPGVYTVSLTAWNDSDENLYQLDITVHPDGLVVTPDSVVSGTGHEGGPFTPEEHIYTLTNVSDVPLDWTAAAGDTWVTFTASAGTLAAGASIDVTVIWAADANLLPAGDYTSTVQFTNTATAFTYTRDVSLTVEYRPGEIAVTDTIVPADDLDMPFDPVNIGALRTEQITVTNSDVAKDLTIATIELLNLEPLPTVKSQAAAGLKVLFMDGGSNPTVLRTALAAFPDMAQVDYLNAGAVLPDITLLGGYDVVIVMSKLPFMDSLLTGNVLADYVDGGGLVVEAMGSFVISASHELAGRFVTEEYGPFAHGTFEFAAGTLGVYDDTNPIMEGISSLTDDIHTNVVLNPGTLWVADWDDGLPLVAVMNYNVVGINMLAFDDGGYGGDVPLLFHNAIAYLLQNF